MTNGINTNPAAHQLIVSSLSNAELSSETNAELGDVGGRRLRNGEGNRQQTILEKGALGRFTAHVLHLGSRTSFVTEQNNRVVAAFAQALQKRNVSRSLSDFSVQQLEARVAVLSSQKTLIKFSDLQAVLQEQDAKAHEILLSYLPAGSQKMGAVFDTPTDGSIFTELAQKHNIDTPELIDKFRSSLEARIFAAANNPELGPEGAMHFLADFAEEAAVGLRPATYDKPVLELFNEFPVGLSKPKILQDGIFQAAGKPDHGAQTFIFFKRTSADNIPYDAQGAVDQRAAAMSGAAAPETPAGRGDWTDARQKFHFSVDKTALHEGKAWPLLHKLLSSEENPFMQWKIGNPLGLHASRDVSIEDVKHKFMEEGPRLANSAGRLKRYNPIPILQNQIKAMTDQQVIRQEMVDRGSMKPEDFDRYQNEIEIKKSELVFVTNEYKKQMEDVSDDRCVDGAQFTLYTQHDPDKPWKSEDVQKYTNFLIKMENILTEAGIEPGKLPESDVTVPGLRFATFRDEQVGDDAEKANKALNYQHPPAWLLDNYRETPFFQLASEALASQVPTHSVQV